MANVINGSDSGETLTGTPGDDEINALGGNDVINASQGADVVNGGAGTTDRLTVTASNAALFAQPTASRTYTITPSLVSDSSGTLNTSITAIERITLSLVGSGDFGDTVNAGTFTQPLDIRVGDGSNNVTAGSGVDSITTGRGNDFVNAGGGNDTINASQGTDQIEGGVGTGDRLTATMSNAALFAAPTGSRTYTITGTQITDSSGTLNTSFTGIEAVALSTVGAGNFGDTVDGSAFAPAAGASASAGLQLLLGAGNDVVTGSGYADNIQTGLGTSVVNAGAGTDVVAVIADTSDGATVFVTNSGGATITTQNGVQTNSILNAETIRVGGLVGTPITIDASAYVTPAGTIFYFLDTNGSDTFIGGTGSEIFGNTTGNVLGNDVFTGGGGADSYDYVFSVGSMDGDTITDFGADDNLDFTFNDPSVGAPDRADKFIGNAAFGNVAGQYRYQISGAQTLVQADTNGDGVADETLTLSNGAYALVETAAGSNILVRAIIAGTDAANTLTGTLNDDIINALGGNDTVFATQGKDQVDGGAQSNATGDRLTINTFNTSLFAAATGSRTYTITANKVTDSSGTLNTSFTGIERISFSTVGNGNFGDTIDASGFTSTVTGQILSMSLGNGNDTVTGSTGSDLVRTGMGTNIVDTGAGYDYVLVAVDNSNPATVFVTSSGGTFITTQNGVQTNSIANADEIQVFGGVAGTTVRIDASAYTAIAGTFVYLVDSNGTDIIIGSDGPDFFGNVTNNVLGNDVFTGNGGADNYDYTYAANAMNGDTITDFDLTDRIDLRFNDDVTSFIGNAAFSGVAGQYRYQITGAKTYVEADINGDSVADYTLTIANGAFSLMEGVGEEAGILRPTGGLYSLNGRVADGYVAGATLFVDGNGNGLLDSGEASTITNADGSFSLPTDQIGPIVAVGGTNNDTGLPNEVTLSAPAGSTIVNPLTTLVQAVVALGGATAEEAETQVKAALGLDPALDLNSFDILAHPGDANALEAQKAAATIVLLIAAVEDVVGPTGEADLLNSLAQLVNDTPAGTPIDFTDTATVGDLLTDTVGAAAASGITAETVAAAEDIEDSTSFAEVASAQEEALLTGNDDANGINGGDQGDAIRAKGGNDIVDGGGGNDFIYPGNGNDDVSGGPGNDVFLFGSEMTVDDKVDGGEGSDQIALQGDYATAPLIFGAEVINVESLVLLPGDELGFGDPGGTYSYNITMANENVAANTRFVIDANRLRTGENFTFNGAAELDGYFYIYGGDGIDNLTGGAGNDVFLFGFFQGSGSNFGAADQVSGGGGHDQLALRGNYTVTLGANQLTSIESLVLLSGRDVRANVDYTYNVTTVDLNLAASQQLVVDGGQLRSGESMTFNGAAETNGYFRIFGGEGNDIVTGGAGNDTIRGRAGNDTITGGAGADALAGEGGDDIVNGGDGADTIIVASGLDTVTGGAGSDTLVVNYASASSAVVMEAPVRTGAVLVGYPPPGGNTFSNAGSTGNAGGRLATYGGFDASQFQNLFWGPAGIGVAMDGAIDEAGETLAYASGIGTMVATWIGQTDVTSINYTGTVYTQYVATIVSGGSAWQAPPAGISGGPAAVSDIDPSGSFEVRQEFLASRTIDGTYEPINIFYNGLNTSGSFLRSSVTGQFAYDDAGFSGSIGDDAGNETAFAGVEKFVITTGSGDDDIATADGDDQISTGAGADTIRGGLGGDRIEGGNGGDTFVYLAAEESTSLDFDTLVGFDYREDRIDLADTVAGWTAPVTSGRLDALTFDADLATALDATLEVDSATLFTASEGDFAGRTFLVIDADGDGAYQADTDFVFEIVSPAVPIDPVTDLFI